MAAGLYLTPASAGPILNAAIPSTLCLAVLFGLVIPMVRLLIKGKYSQVAFSLLISLAAAAAAVALASAGFRAARAGNKNFDKVKERTESMRNIL